MRTNPDGDVEIPGAAYDEFVVPDCPTCMLEGRSNNVVRSTSRLFFLHKGLLFGVASVSQSVGRSLTYHMNPAAQTAPDILWGVDIPKR